MSNFSVRMERLFNQSRPCKMSYYLLILVLACVTSILESEQQVTNRLIALTMVKCCEQITRYHWYNMTNNFSWGAVNHFPKTFSQVAQIFAKQSNTKKDHRPEYGVKIILHLNLQREYCWVLVYLIIWQAPRAGKMNQIAQCDWLPERARWSHPARSGLPAVSRKKNFTESHIINLLLTKFVRSRWLDIGLVLFLRVYGPRLRLGP